MIFQFFLTNKECHGRAKRLGNVKLQLDCLMNSLRVTKQLSKDDSSREEQTYTILTHAYNVGSQILFKIQTSKGMGEKKLANICLCNLGVLSGKRDYGDFIAQKEFDKYRDE